MFISSLRSRSANFGITIVALMSFIGISHTAEVQKFELHNIAEILKNYHIQEPLNSIVDIATDAKGKNFAFLFIDKKYAYVDSIGVSRNLAARIYLNDKKIYEGGWEEAGACVSFSSNLFDMTDDAHVLFVPDCMSLYVDGKLVGISRNASRGLGRGYAYSNGKLIFPSGTIIKGSNRVKEDDVIKEFNLANKKTKVLFRHRGKEIDLLQVANGNIAYLLKEGNRLVRSEPSSFPNTSDVTWGDISYYESVWGVYVNGKKIKSNVVNPMLFLSSNGTTYTYEETKDGYILYAGKNSYATGIDLPGIVNEEDAKSIWYTDFHRNKNDDITGFSLFRDKTAKKIPAGLLGIDMFVASNNHYSFLANLSQTGSVFRLVSDGIFIGAPISLHFPSVNNNDNLFFGMNGKLYMRAENTENKGFMSENGLPIFAKEFTDILLIRKESNKAISIYGIQ